MHTRPQHTNIWMSERTDGCEIRPKLVLGKGQAFSLATQPVRSEENQLHLYELYVSKMDGGGKDRNKIEAKKEIEEG